MKLTEIFNTKPDVQWSKVSNVHLGEFTLDNVDYAVEIGEFETDSDKTIINLGFTANDSIVAVNGKKPAARVIGAVINAAISKIQEIKPDAILILIDKNSGLVDSRKSLYTALFSALKLKMSIIFDSGWKESTTHWSRIFASYNPSKEEIEQFTVIVQSK